jgi:hypothetical protein
MADGLPTSAATLAIPTMTLEGPGHRMDVRRFLDDVCALVDNRLKADMLDH